MSAEENILVRTTNPAAGESIGERRLTTKGIAFFGALTVFLLLLHAADEIARGEAAQAYGSVGGAAEPKGPGGERNSEALPTPRRNLF